MTGSERSDLVAENADRILGDDRAAAAYAAHVEAQLRGDSRWRLLAWLGRLGSAVAVAVAAFLSAGIILSSDPVVLPEQKFPWTI